MQEESLGLCRGKFAYFPTLCEFDTEVTSASDYPNLRLGFSLDQMCIVWGMPIFDFCTDRALPVSFPFSAMSMELLLQHLA